MNRRMVSLAGVLVAVFGLTFGGSDAEARCCRQRIRCCQQPRNFGCQTTGISNCGQNPNWGRGCGLVRNNGCQQSRCNTVATACCTPQSGGYITQPGYAPAPPANVAPPMPAVEEAPAPKPAA